MSEKKAKSGLLLRRRNKLVGFIILEAIAIGLLLIVGTFAVLLRKPDPALALSINITTIAAVALIPIIFFAISPVLPRDNRRQ